MKSCCVFLGVAILFGSCIFEHDSPNPQSSTSIKQSKELGVFRSSVRASKTTLTVNNQEINIDEMWIEDVWFHDKSRRSDNKQIVVRVRNWQELSDDFLKSWSLGVKEVTYGSGNGNIIIGIDQDTAKSYVLYLYKYGEPYSLPSRTKVDSLIIEKVPK